VASSRAVILVGGSSSRMGFDKATMSIAGVPNATRLGRLLIASGVGSVELVGGDGGRFASDDEFPHRPDLSPGRGPLEGIRTGLLASPAEWTLFVAVDLVSLNVEAVTRMAASLSRHPFDDVIHAESSDGPQPLFGWWRRSVAQTIERQLSIDRRSVRDTVSMLRVATVEFAPEILRNANRPEDLG